MRYVALIVTLLVFSGCERKSYVTECVNGSVVNTVYHDAYVGDAPKNSEFYTESNIRLQWVGSDKNNHTIRCSE